MTQIIQNLSVISSNYNALFCDLWGCLHNGLTPFPAAIKALRDFKANGGTIILLTNAPRPGTAVRKHLANMQCPEDCWDAIVSSGDAARASLMANEWGDKCYHIGPERDHPTFEGLPIKRVPIAEAEFMLCTGLFDDETETPEDYAELIKELYCAGAIAEAYKNAGGKAVYYGKPHAPIYAYAKKILTDFQPDNAKILCVGDGVGTDVKGAKDAGLDCLFVTGGLAAEEVSNDVEQPEQDRLVSFLDKHKQEPKFAIGRLR